MCCRHLADDGLSVDYDGMLQSDDFKAFKEQIGLLKKVRQKIFKNRVLTTSLPKIDVNTLTADEAKAFWINLYNALEIHARLHVREMKAENDLKRVSLLTLLHQSQLNQ